MTVLKNLISSIAKAAHYNPDVQVAPACILWPDGERQFESIVPQLLSAMPELLVLGDYAPVERTGPAIWLRYALAGKIPEYQPGENLPVIYLPGVSRSAMRIVENYPDTLKPLAYYQYRGNFFSQVNGKDWTILAFLKSGDGGLQLDVATDEATKNAMQLSFPLLLDQEVELLRNKRLDKDFFNKLITGGDPVKDILQWLNSGDAWRKGKSEVQWKAFVELCKSNYGFNPELDGHRKGLILFANRQGVWRSVFDRYVESYTMYSNIAPALQELPCPDFDLFCSEEEYGGWPQWNEHEELKLLRDLESLLQLTEKNAFARLEELERQHSIRRNLIWSTQGNAPLALALLHLLELAHASAELVYATSVSDLGDYYEKQGYRADLAAWRAIAHIKGKKNRDVVKSVVRLFYQPWLEKTANHLQKLLMKEDYPASCNRRSKSDTGICYIFVDGLRLDLAKELSERLTQNGMIVTSTPRWVPLPSMTANGKPAAVPVAESLDVSTMNQDFDPLKAAGISFAKYLTGQNIATDSISDNICWKEFGDIDQAGHDHGGDMPLHLIPLLDSLYDMVEATLQAGFHKIKLVSDHGWLYLPGGLPKQELSIGLTDGKWGRYAVLKEGAGTDEIQKPWFWNSNITVTLPHGICSHRAGMEYAHGGLSLQECLLLELTVSPKIAKVQHNVSIDESQWRGLRCRYKLTGNFPECIVDLRKNPATPKSLLAKCGTVNEDGSGSVIVADDSLLGQVAFLVVLDKEQHIVAQKLLQVGE